MDDNCQRAGILLTDVAAGTLMIKRRMQCFKALGQNNNFIKNALRIFLLLKYRARIFCDLIV